MNNKQENNKRLEVLYKESHQWLLAASFNITKNRELAEDLVGELYLYLGEKVNPSAWWGDSFNVMYCYSFIKTRFLNKIKRDKKINYQAELPTDSERISDEPYDESFDADLDMAYNEVVEELKRMEYTKNWATSKIAQLYFFNDFTLETLSKEIKVAKSTSFLHVKKCKQHLRNTIQNPFK